MRWSFGKAVVVLLSLLWSASSAEAGVTRYVSAIDPTCAGHSPCHATIQAAVGAAQAGDTVRIHAGTYVEQVAITGKNNTAAATEASRIVIEADPGAAAGSVVLHGSASQCTLGYAIQLQQSKFVTIRGLTITGAGGQAIALAGGGGQNRAIHIERNRIFGNGSASCSGGITIHQGNADTLIVNNVIYGNGRHGVVMSDTDGGPHVLIGNTIHGNGWSGVAVARSHEVLLANNAITGNGTSAGTTGGRVGVRREGSSAPEPAGIQLLNNLVCGNRLGEIDGPALDGTDSGNRTPSGAEGPGVTASPGCAGTATLYLNAYGLDQLPFTADDDFTPAAGSPLLDNGVDPRTLGLPVALNPVLEADFFANGIRPQVGGQGAAPFDIGAIERLASGDTVAPTVTIVEPAGSFVRGSVSVRAEASDGGGIAGVTILVDGQPLAVELTPPAPAASVSARAAWTSTSAGDGPHTIAATATDASGNSTTTQKVAISDNTPPNTQIISGPSGAIAGPTATFGFEGTDNVSAAGNLVFAWRVDGGPFTSFGVVTTAALSGLAPGVHTFEVKARDQAGSEDPSPAQRSFSVSGLALTIAQPSGGATIPAGVLLVRGAVTSGSPPIGVTVNGLPAVVGTGMYTALIPVDVMTTSVTVVATDGAGASASQSVNVGVVASTSPPIVLLASPAGGVAPLQVSFSLSRSLVGASVQLDLQGDGTAEFTGASLDGQAFAYTQAGLYVATATVTDGQGHQFVARTIVQVFDQTSLDALLRARWAALKDALRAGDIARGLAEIAITARAAYGEAFQVLAARLPQIDTILTDISLNSILDGEAFFDAVRMDGGVPRSFEVRFVVDLDGVWRIESF